jgi:hypothetical protein
MTSLGTDFEKRVEEPAAKNFVVRKVLSNRTKCKEPSGMRSSAKSAWEVIQKLSSDKQQSTFFASLEIPWGFLSQAVLRWLSGGLCHTRKCQFGNFAWEKVWFCDCLTDVCMRNLRQKAEKGKKASTNSCTWFPQASCFEKMSHVCQKYGGACTTWYSVYKRYKNGMRYWSPAQSRKVQRN